MYHQDNSMTHDPILSIMIMVLASIIIGYYLTMTIILRRNLTNNKNKYYQSLLMGFWMGFIELAMIRLLMNIWSPILTLILIVLLIGIVILTIFIHYQIGINENQYMLSMIEHHQMAIEMSERVKPKVTNLDLLQIMNNIIESQQKEIEQMRSLLIKNNVPDNITSLLY